MDRQKGYILSELVSFTEEDWGNIRLALIVAMGNCDATSPEGKTICDNWNQIYIKIGELKKLGYNINMALVSVKQLQGDLQRSF